MSELGTNRTISNVRYPVATGGNADIEVAPPRPCGAGKSERSVRTFTVTLKAPADCSYVNLMSGGGLAVPAARLVAMTPEDSRPSLSGGQPQLGIFLGERGYKFAGPACKNCTLFCNAFVIASNSVHVHGCKMS